MYGTIKKHVKVRDALAQAGAFFKEKGVDEPRLEAEVLLAYILGCSRAGLYRDHDKELSEPEAKAFAALVRRRGQGEPVAYLTGHKEFMGLNFKVNRFVLIPRPETELLVEKAFELLPGVGLDICRKQLPGPLNGMSERLFKGYSDGECLPAQFSALLPVADVGTGCGAVAVSLAKLHPLVRVYAVDISGKALKVAAENAAAHGVEERVSFHRGDLLAPLEKIFPPAKGFDKSASKKATVPCRGCCLITANLPYVPSGELSTLPRDVRFEPVVALDGGADGLEVYRRLVPQAYKTLAPGGHLLIEIDPRQVGLVPDLFPQPKWKICVLPDLTGRERLVHAKKVC